MTTKTHTLNLSTTQKTQWLDITASLQSLVDISGIQTGEMFLFVPHTTAAVTLNEHVDPDVRHDMTLGLNEVFYEKNTFLHAEANSHAHIKSSLIGTDQMLLIDEGSLVLGTWQGVYFCEFDGPRTRRLVVRLRGH